MSADVTIESTQTALDLVTRQYRQAQLAEAGAKTAHERATAVRKECGDRRAVLDGAIDSLLSGRKLTSDQQAAVIAASPVPVEPKRRVRTVLTEVAATDVAA